MFLLILKHLYTSKYLATLIVIELTNWIKIYENLFDSGLIVQFVADWLFEENVATWPK